MVFYCFCYLLSSLLRKYIVEITKKESYYIEKNILRKINQYAVFSSTAITEVCFVDSDNS